MQCPKCHSAMELIVEPEASAHRCTRCKGLWFEMMAHETLKHRAEEIDIGDRHTCPLQRLRDVQLDSASAMAGR